MDRAARRDPWQGRSTSYHLEPISNLQNVGWGDFVYRNVIQAFQLVAANPNHPFLPKK